MISQNSGKSVREIYWKGTICMKHRDLHQRPYLDPVTLCQHPLHGERGENADKDNQPHTILSMGLKMVSEIEQIWVKRFRIGTGRFTCFIYVTFPNELMTVLIIYLFHSFFQECATFVQFSIVECYMVVESQKHYHRNVSGFIHTQEGAMSQGRRPMRVFYEFILCYCLHRDVKLFIDDITSYQRQPIYIINYQRC